MKKIFLSLSLVLISLFAVGYGYGLFQDTVVVADNKFYSAIFQLELSTTDDDGDNLAEPHPDNWSKDTTGVWASDFDWMPGETITSPVFLRNNSRIDAEAVYLTMTDRTYYGEAQLDQVVNLIEAWYDRNADGVQAPEEDILPALTQAYDTDGGQLSLRELYDGLDLAHAGQAFDLEAENEVLAGSLTDDTIGGPTGSGKGLFLTWQYDPNADVSYQDAWVDFDLEFTAEQATN